MNTNEENRLDVMSYNIGSSDYSKHRIQPWDIWEEYNLNPWDADIIKRVLRTKEGEDRKTDYEKIIHICRKRIQMLESGKEEQPASISFRYPVPIVLEEGGILPTKSTDGAAAYDLYAPCNTLVKPGRNIVPLGFRMALPYGIGATVHSRSGFASKGFECHFEWEDVMRADGFTMEPRSRASRADADVKWGLIDSDYRGVSGVIIQNHEDKPFLLTRGTRFAQMCFQKYEDVEFVRTDKLDETDRGDGGFGHTGTK